MRPKIDGLTLIEQLRKRKATNHVIILSAKHTVDARIKGLQAGGDDYLVKPFAFDELLARIRALLRRRQPATEGQVLRFADVTINLATREVRRGERPISLTAKEFDLLELFMRHARQVLTRDTIYDHVWGYDFGGESNIIEVYVRYLRSKLEAGGEPRLLQTVRGVGYVLREE